MKKTLAAVAVLVAGVGVPLAAAPAADAAPPRCQFPAASVDPLTGEWSGFCTFNGFRPMAWGK